MLTPTEYRLTCDNGAQCVSDNRFFDEGQRLVVKARTATEARQRAKDVGWIRCHGRDRRLIDLCPDCAKGGAA